MSDTPLVPFPSPFAVLEHWGVGAGGVIQIFLFIVFSLWLIYTFVVIYHWLKYSHASLVSLPAIFIHLAVSFGIMSYALTGTPLP